MRPPSRTFLTSEMARSLLSRYGSPLYVYSEEQLLSTMQAITTSFSYPHTDFFFAAVTNGNVSLLRLFHDQGWGLHANTPGDVFLALTAGFSPEKIVYSGSNLNYEDMQYVLDSGVGFINLDSLDQLKLCCDVFNSRPHRPLSLGLRLNHTPLTGESRIGIVPEDFSRAVELARQAGLTIEGLHFYRGTGTSAVPAFTSAFQPILSLARRLPDCSFLDLGGGFGHSYMQKQPFFDWSRFGAAITEALAEFDRPIRLLIEPGRSAIAGSAVLLTTVVSIKWQGSKQIVGVDTTTANLAVLSVHGGSRQVVFCGDSKSGSPAFRTDICGNTTFSRDYLCRDCELPPLTIGDILMILDVGAYGFSMSSHFLHRPRPAEVLISPHDERLIRMRESLSDLLNHQVLS